MRIETEAHSPALYHSGEQSRPTGEGRKMRTLLECVRQAGEESSSVDDEINGTYFFINCFGQTLSFEELQQVLPWLNESLTEDGDVGVPPRISSEQEDEQEEGDVDISDYLDPGDELDKLIELVNAFLNDACLRGEKYSCKSDCRGQWTWTPMKKTAQKERVVRALSGWLTKHPAKLGLLPEIFKEHVHRWLTGGRSLND
jgi:hypothetical protein